MPTPFQPPRWMSANTVFQAVSVIELRVFPLSGRPAARRSARNATAARCETFRLGVRARARACVCARRRHSEEVGSQHVKQVSDCAEDSDLFRISPAFVWFNLPKIGAVVLAIVLSEDLNGGGKGRCTEDMIIHDPKDPKEHLNILYHHLQQVISCNICEV